MMMLHNVENEYMTVTIYTTYTNIIDKHAMKINNDYALCYETQTYVYTYTHLLFMKLLLSNRTDMTVYIYVYLEVP